MDPKELFLEELALIERVAAFVARSGGLSDADAEDFVSSFRLRLIERDYEVLRRFEGRCSLRSYLTIVAQRMLLDVRVHLFGKWHPSTVAMRLGEVAVVAERMLKRDRMPADEVVGRICAMYAGVRAEDVHAMLARFPERRHHVRFVCSEQEEVETAVAPERAEDALENNRRTALAEETSRCVRLAIDGMPDAERLLFRLRFEGGLTIAQISRMLGIEQKPLYRRLARSLRDFRCALESRGIGWHDVELLIEHRSVDLDFGFGRENLGASPSILQALGTRDEEGPQ